MSTEPWIGVEGVDYVDPSNRLLDRGPSLALRRARFDTPMDTFVPFFNLWAATYQAWAYWLDAAATYCVDKSYILTETTRRSTYCPHCGGPCRGA